MQNVHLKKCPKTYERTCIYYQRTDYLSNKTELHVFGRNAFIGSLCEELSLETANSAFSKCVDPLP